MKTFWDYYSSIPLLIDPTAIKVGFFSISWYALMYIIGFLVVYSLLMYRIKRGELKIGDTSKFSSRGALVLDLLIVVFLGLLIGGRLGYVIFYDPKYYLVNPLNIVSPFDAAGKFVGIYGMSYHGGLIGAILAGLLFSKRNKVSFVALSNFISPAIPAGYFFGRMGNFLNNELYGRVTTKSWGMYFSNDPTFQLRHPSQLYEAFGEGIVLFIILWIIRNRDRYKENLLLFYIIGYSLFRIICEFFREPDGQIGFIAEYFTLGQLLSTVVLTVSLVVLWKKRQGSDIIKRSERYSLEEG